MPYVIHFSPAAARALEALPPRRAQQLRESLQQRLEAAARLAALRRFDDGVANEHFSLRVGDYETRYSVDRPSGELWVHDLVRLPSSRLPPVG
jgi:mRNA-degrading endonuclease RelE of RelBE toxin-antitoxin system